MTTEIDDETEFPLNLFSIYSFLAVHKEITNSELSSLSKAHFP